jgi:hypothetical protein
MDILPQPMEPVHPRPMTMLRGSIPIALAASACVPFGTSALPLVANVAVERGQCRVTVNSQRVTQPQLLDLARKANTRRGIVVYAKDAPYKCLGAAIITMQQAGLQSVDVAMWDGT